MQAKMVSAGAKVTEENKLSAVSLQRSAAAVGLKADR
jgi:hypothetical protein